jgi:hypothetical protein
MPEVIKIVQTRWGTYSKYMDYKIELTNELKIVGIFQNKYPGSKKLKITRSDALIFKDVMRGAITKERLCFRAFLNTQGLPPKRKIEIWMNRRNVTRFTV